MHFYNSITLLGEFYHRLYKKQQPVLVIGRSLLEILTKELRNETKKCTNDPIHVFDVQFARLLLTQVSFFYCDLSIFLDVYSNNILIFFLFRYLRSL